MYPSLYQTETTAALERCALSNTHIALLPDRDGEEKHDWSR
jgi:hypothetical protein